MGIVFTIGNSISTKKEEEGKEYLDSCAVILLACQLLFQFGYIQEIVCLNQTGKLAHNGNMFGYIA